MPATVAQPYTPPAVQGNVIALYAQGTSKRRIARDLGIGRNTVDAILARYSQSEPTNTSRVQRILPIAYDTVEKAISSGDARIAMDLLKLELSRGPATMHVHGDAHLTQAVQMLAVPAPSGTTSTPITAGSTGTEQPIEAAAKAAPTSLDLSSRTNFSQFSLAELEAEVARRKAALVLDAETVEAK